MRFIYVSHPYTGNEEENTRRARAIVMALREKRPWDFFFCPLGDLPASWDYETCMWHCIELLKKCDGLILCHDWEESKGCQMELEAAREFDIPVYYLDDLLCEDLAKEPAEKKDIGRFAYSVDGFTFHPTAESQIDAWRQAKKADGYRGIAVTARTRQLDYGGFTIDEPRAVYLSKEARAAHKAARKGKQDGTDCHG